MGMLFERSATIMTPTHVDSPLRRSEAHIFRAPIPVPVVNDDEAERRAARERSMVDTSSTSSMVTEREGLTNCLKIFHENKFTKENAWDVPIIDHFSSLIDKHHKSLANFQIVGSTLEASSKIYGLRVDSVHTDVLRMSSGLTRPKVVDNSIEVNDEAVGGDEFAGDGENGSGTPKQPKAKKKRVRRAVSTITKNKDTINGRLDAHPFTDAIFAKLNSFDGNQNSSNRLLQNVLTTVDSELILSMEHKYWESSESNHLEDIEIENIEYDDSSYHFLPTKPLVTDRDKLRQQHFGYLITDTPAEEDPKDVSLNQEKSFDQAQLAIAFDINAEVEPVPTGNGFLDVDLGDDPFDDLPPDEQTAIGACRGLRRAPVIIEDMRPVDSTSSQLEYSYRPLNNISQFWAGPSHWKFKRPRNRSTLFRNAQSSKMGEFGHRTNNKKSMRNRLAPLKMVDDLDYKNIFLDVGSKEAQKLKKTNIYKRWDAKKLKLPTDLQLDRLRFDTYYFAPGIPVSTIEPNVMPSVETGGYDYNNAQDREYCTNLPADLDTDTEATSLAGGDDFHDDGPCLTPSQPVDVTVNEIGTEFEGAPEKVQQIKIHFAKRAKVVDMKQLKRCVFSLLLKQCDETKTLPQPIPDDSNEKFQAGAGSFKKIYNELPQLLSPNMKEALSPAVAFYSILHLANEKKLRLVNDETDGFKILRLEEK